MKMDLGHLPSEKNEGVENDIDEVVEMHIQDIDITADVEALVDGEELSEEFKEKAATIFEATLSRRPVKKLHGLLKNNRLRLLKKSMSIKKLSQKK